jgi:2-aminobenzoate-CoA ligase
MSSAQTDRFVAERLPPPEQWPELLYDLPELRRLQATPQLNLVQVLFEQVTRQGGSKRPFLRSPSLTLTYAQAQERVNRIAQVLTQDLGLMPGNRVLLRGGNSVGMALAWLAVVKAGLITVATMPLLRAKELGDIIDKAQPRVALCDAALLAELQLAQGQHTVLETIISFLPNSDLTSAPSASGLAIAPARAGVPPALESLAPTKNGQFEACPTFGDDIALLVFTSGTTGLPKAAAHSHRDVLAACETWPRHVLKATPEDVVMGSPPLAFSFGLGGLLIFPMWAGASVYFPDRPYTPQGMAQLMFDTGATICYTAPTFYRQMAPFMADEAQKRGHAAKLRLCVSAGEGLPDATRQLWREATGIEMLDGIGATEMFHIFISSPPDQVRRGAIGQVVPGYIAKVVDEAGHEVPHGTVGRLAVKGATGCKYMGDARQLNYVKDGWNYPGDAFTQDDDGYFFYQSRADDMIITSGYNVGAPEVEDALLKHPAVAECGVVGVADEARGMVVKAFCVLKPGFEGDAAMVKTLQDFVKASIAPFKYPREIEFLARLPRTETGKLQRFKLKTP